MDVSATYFSQHMGRVLQHVLSGQTVTVTRYNSQVAVLEPVDEQAEAGATPVSSTELFQNLGGYLDRVVSGEQFIITRHGRPIALMHDFIE